MMKKTVCVVLMLLCTVFSGCRKTPPEPLRIACDDEMIPVLTALGREFRDNFGVNVTPVPFSEDQLLLQELTQFDFVITDNLSLVDRLLETGKISTTTAFAETAPVLIVRKSDKFPVLKIDDMKNLQGRPLRLTLATNNTTLHRIVMSKLEQFDLSPQSEGSQTVLVPFVVGEISSDGTQRRTTPTSMLQQLRDGETDVIACWDFVAGEALFNQPDADDFVVIDWPKDTDSTIAIPLCLIKDCKEYTRCGTFVDFVKSNRGQEILFSRFLAPADDLIGDY